MAETMQAPRAADTAPSGEAWAARRTSRSPSSLLARQLDTAPPVQRLEAIRGQLSPVQRVAASAPVVQRVINVEGAEPLDRDGLIAMFSGQSDVVRALRGADADAALTAAYTLLDGRTFASRKALQKKVVDAVKGFINPRGNAPAQVQLGQYIGVGRQYVPDALLAAIDIRVTDALHAKIGLLAAAQQGETCTRFGTLLAHVVQLVQAGTIGKAGVGKMIEAMTANWSADNYRAAETETAIFDPGASMGGPLVGANVAVKGMIGELDGLVAAAGHQLAPHETVFSGATYTSQGMQPKDVTEDVDISYIDAGGTLWLVEAAYDGNVLRNKTRGGQDQKKRYKQLAQAETLIHQPLEGLSHEQSGEREVRAVAFAYTIPRAALQAMEASWSGRQILDLLGFMGSGIHLLVDGADAKAALRTIGERKAQEEEAV